VKVLGGVVGVCLVVENDIEMSYKREKIIGRRGVPSRVTRTIRIAERTVFFSFSFFIFFLIYLCYVNCTAEELDDE
jgi:hypothetical protein